MENGQKVPCAGKTPSLKSQAMNLKTASKPVPSDGTVHPDHSISRAVINFWLDAVLATLLVSLIVISTIVQFVFPPGTAAKGWLLWGLTFNQWMSLQFGVLAVFGGACIIHVMLHWAWVCAIVSRKLLRRPAVPNNGVQTILGVGLLVGLAVLGLVVFEAAVLTIQRPEI